MKEQCILLVHTNIWYKNYFQEEKKVKLENMRLKVVYSTVNERDTKMYFENVLSDSSLLHVKEDSFTLMLLIVL